MPTKLFYRTARFGNLPGLQTYYCMELYLKGKTPVALRHWQILLLSVMFFFVANSSNAQSREEVFPRHLFIKTNAVGWAMLISNVAVEIEVDKHWSINFPIYYSALNYFTSTVKFRTFALQPELRYWFTDTHKGWFTGAHLGLAWFNYAKGGDWRYQDHHRHSPLYGGGIGGGYRMSISKNERWLMEFSLGCGIYHLNYDIFHNEPNGQLVDNKKRTFYGIDHVGVSFAYRFDLKKKGGKQ